MPGWNQSGWGTSFYDPASAYGGTKYQPGEFGQSGAGQEYYDQNPEVAWTEILGQLGFDPSTAKGQFGRGLWPQVMEGYKAALLNNPSLKIQEYVKTIDPNRMYQNQSARDRGENQQAFSTRARTIGRAYGA